MSSIARIPDCCLSLYLASEKNKALLSQIAHASYSVSKLTLSDRKE